MKFNRIAIIAILAILTVVLAGSASAFDLGFLSGGDSEPQEITPAGFNENEEYKMVNEKSNTSGIDYYMSSAGFEDDTGEKAIYILVGDYDEYNVTDEIIEYVLNDMDYERKTINGHNGYLVQQTTSSSSSLMAVEMPVYMFVYEENGDLVFIGATDESYFNDVIIE